MRDTMVLSLGCVLTSGTFALLPTGVYVKNAVAKLGGFPRVTTGLGDKCVWHVVPLDRLQRLGVKPTLQIDVDVATGHVLDLYDYRIRDCRVNRMVLFDGVQAKGVVLVRGVVLRPDWAGVDRWPGVQVKRPNACVKTGNSGLTDVERQRRQKALALSRMGAVDLHPASLA